MSRPGISKVFASATRAGKAQRGFTLLELLVTLAIIGLITQIVFLNMGAMVPKTKLDSEAKRLVSNLDWLRSEARIQGKRYRMELDLTRDRWRLVQPAEERISMLQTDEELAERFLQWNELEDDVVYRGAGNADQRIIRDGIYKIEFDENGFTGDQSVFLSLGQYEEMVWTIHIHGLTGRAEILPDFEGKEHLPQPVGEGAF